MGKLTLEERVQIAKTIRIADRLFDGHYEKGVHVKNKPEAYAVLRKLALDLAARLDK